MTIDSVKKLWPVLTLVFAAGGGAATAQIATNQKVDKADWVVDTVGRHYRDQYMLQTLQKLSATQDTILRMVRSNTRALCRMGATNVEC